MARGLHIGNHTRPTIGSRATPPIQLRFCVSEPRGVFFAEAQMNARSKLLVVGNGMVGQRFLESLPPDAPFDITVLAEEPRPAYDRVQLSAFFSGKTADDLSLVSPAF